MTSTTVVTQTGPTTSTSSAVNTTLGFLTLSTIEVPLVEAILEAIIPTDSNGPGAKEAGAIYFIDRQLASDYGKSAYMYRAGPFVSPDQTGSVTVNSLAGTPITYSGGSAPTIMSSTTNYQYAMMLRDFWRYGLQALETYSNSAYGGNFESLSSTIQVKVLTDLYNNVPTSFNYIKPQDLFYELFFMAWCGFLMDPLYGGNMGMVGWSLLGFNGVNTGNFYGEGMTSQQLMLATTPTKLQPASLAQLQQASGLGS